MDCSPNAGTPATDTRFGTGTHKLPPSRPDPLAAIDIDWLSNKLAAAGHQADGIGLLSATAVGHGNTSEVARLKLSSATPDLPDTLIAKLPRLLPDGSAPLAEVFGYDREVAAYRFFGARPAFRIPHCYVAERDLDGGFTLLLEDLGAGCRPGDQAAGCGIDEAEAVVRELAALHRLYWRSPQLAGLDWPSRRWNNAERTSRFFPAGAAVMRERYSQQLGAAALDLIDAVVPLVRDWAAAEPFEPTLIHADPRVDNIIFDERDDEMRACLIDLQSISVGDAGFDLAYFLTGSLEPEARAACEKRLVAKHAAIIREVDSGYSDAKAWRRYRQYQIAGLLGTVTAAGLLPSKPQLDAQLIALARRNCAAIAALDGIAGARDRIQEFARAR